MIAPPRLKAGDKVALLAPSRAPTETYIKALVEVLERQGLVPVLHPQLHHQAIMADGRIAQLAGTDEDRAAAFNETLNNPEIKAVFFPRAGTGSYRILDKLDYNAATRHPKIIIGFSDVEPLLLAISERSGLITFRGPVGSSYASPTIDPRTEAECFELLTGQRTEWKWHEGTALKTGSAEGALIGGNIATLNAQIGTPFEIKTDGKIVIFEECDELVFRLDRFLYQAAKSGKFAKAKAVLFGKLENMLDGEQHDGSGSPFGKDVAAMLRDFIPPHIPLAYGLPLGHGPYLSSHPIGAMANVEITKAGVTMKLLEPAVI